jgi:hypothetical protein
MALPQLNQPNTKALKPRQHQQENWHTATDAKTCFRTQAKRRILKTTEQDVGQTKRPTEVEGRQEE